MRGEIALANALLALVVVAGGVATFCFGFWSFLDGQTWQAVVFACGGLYLSLWAGFRLTSSPAAPRRRPDR